MQDPVDGIVITVVLRTRYVLPAMVTAVPPVRLNRCVASATNGFFSPLLPRKGFWWNVWCSPEALVFNLK